MRKALFALTATFLMVVIGFGAMSVNAVDPDCALISGRVSGLYTTAACEPGEVLLEGIPVTITASNGVTETPITSTAGRRTAGGMYSEDVLKTNQLTYVITVSHTMEIDGVRYKFEYTSPELTVLDDVTHDIIIKGVVDDESQAKEYTFSGIQMKDLQMFVISFMHRLQARLQHILN